VSAGDCTLTYRELDDRTNRVAQVFSEMGAEAGERVAVLDKSSIEVVEVLLGAAKLGLVTVPLNWRLAVSELTAVVRDSGATILVAHADFAEAIAEIEASAASKLSVITIGQDYEPRLMAAPALDPGHSGVPGDVVLMLDTSGTTGLPKGVLTTNENLNAVMTCGEPWGFDESSVSLCAMPMFHIGGLGLLLVGLACGAHNVIVRDIDPNRLLDTIEHLRITNTFGCPVLGVWGAQEMALTEQQMRDSQKYVDGEWRYERFEDVGHWIPAHASTRLGKLLVDFVA
jgi:acyl-CoA synthetase (AMP-forming)/AMP-acid ligase II